MRIHKLLVIGNPQAPFLQVLPSLEPMVEISIGNDAETLRTSAREADVVFVTTGNSDVLKVLWPDLQSVRWIHSLSAGLEHVLFPELADSPVVLSNSSGVFAESLGEWCIAAMLFFAKDFRRLVKAQIDRRWEPFDCVELRRQSVGIFGYGGIGRSVKSRAQAMGMQVHAVRRRPERHTDDGVQIWPMENLAEMVAAVDYLVVSAPLTQETRGRIGEREIGRMKQTAVLLNVGRGPVVDEQALLAALTARSIRGAALDVFDEEPLPPEHPFWSLDNVLLSPHTADHTATWLDEGVEFFMANYRRFAAGEELKNIVDKRAGY